MYVVGDRAAAVQDIQTCIRDLAHLEPGTWQKAHQGLLYHAHLSIPFLQKALKRASYEVYRKRLVDTLAALRTWESFARPESWHR